MDLYSPPAPPATRQSITLQPTRGELDQPSPPDSALSMVPLPCCRTEKSLWMPPLLAHAALFLPGASFSNLTARTLPQSPIRRGPALIHPSWDACWYFPRAKSCLLTALTMLRSIRLREPSTLYGSRPSTAPPATSPLVLPGTRSWARSSTASHRAPCMATMRNQPPTIRWCESPTTQRTTCSMPLPTITAAWASPPEECRFQRCSILHSTLSADRVRLSWWPTEYRQHP